MPKTVTVALRNESVDRNIMLLIILLCGLRSLSARRAWIEIRVSILTMLYTVVALRKESVDRNLGMGQDEDGDAGGRSPQGERG